MTLHEAVIYAKEEGYRWLAIDDNSSIYAYNEKPEVGSNLWNDVAPHCNKYIFVDECHSPLDGNFTNWIIDLEELTL